MQNQNQSGLGHVHFPALGVGDVNLKTVLIELYSIAIFTTATTRGEQLSFTLTRPRVSSQNTRQGARWARGDAKGKEDKVSLSGFLHTHLTLRSHLALCRVLSEVVWKVKTTGNESIL